MQTVLFAVESLSLFIAFLYLDLYVLGDDALLNWGGGGGVHANQTSVS